MLKYSQFLTSLQDIFYKSLLQDKERKFKSAAKILEKVWSDPKTEISQNTYSFRNLNKNEIDVLINEGLVTKISSDTFQLQEKGKKALNTIILANNNSIIDEANIITASNNKKIKTASKSSNKLPQEWQDILNKIKKS